MGENYKIIATPENILKGKFSPDKLPVLRICDGTTVEIETINSDIAALEKKTTNTFADVKETEREELSIRDEDPEPYYQKYGIRIDTPGMRKLCAALDEAEPKGYNSQCNTGPIAIEGALPGDVLEIQIRKLELTEPCGCMFLIPGIGGAPDIVSHSVCQRVIYNEERTETELFGQKITLEPFLGIMAVADKEDKIAQPPGLFGGNLDLKELKMGTSLFLPVLVKDALFYAGDPHAVQGNGESGMTAIETCGLNCTLKFVLHKNKYIDSPQAETPDYFVITGLDEDLNEAAHKAVKNAAAFIAEKNKLKPEQALMLCGAAVDFDITQIVDGVKGVHAMIPKSIINMEDHYFWNADGHCRYNGKETK